MFEENQRVFDVTCPLCKKVFPGIVIDGLTVVQCGCGEVFTVYTQSHRAKPRMIYTRAQNFVSEKWISVAERRPRDGQWFVGLKITQEQDFMSGSPSTGYVLFRGYPKACAASDDYDYWMPLPDPPKDVHQP